MSAKPRTRAAAHAPDARRDWRATWPVDAVRVLSSLQRGRNDPCHQVHGGSTVWRTARVADGPVVARIDQIDRDRVACAAWGPGAEMFVERLPSLLGADDPADAFDPGDHPLVGKLHRMAPWLRMPRTGQVFEALVGAVLEQRVTATEAIAARTTLIRQYGSPPPATPTGMPSGLRVMPAASTWLEIPSWEWHRAGVDVHRTETLLRCAQVAGRLEETTTMDRDACMRRMRSIRGVGVWTVAETLQRSHGDPDSVSYGDVHLARFVGYALTGRGVDDHGMEQLLEPWRGHRHRVIRLLQLAASLGAVATAPRIRQAPARRHLRY